MRPAVHSGAGRSGDVTRFHGLWLSALFAAVLVLLLALVSDAPSVGDAPGALSNSHATARLACSDCHKKNRSAPPTCDSCHQNYESRRRGHSELFPGGRISCSTCHRGHGPDTAIATSDGTVVSVIPAARCRGCHRLGSNQDPIAVCLQGPEVGSNSPTLCLDEHRAVGGVRDAAWEEVRHIAVTVRAARPSSYWERHAAWSWLALGLLLGLGARVVVRSLGTRNIARPEVVLRAPELLRLPQVNPVSCLGCHACVDVCPFDVLVIRDYVAVVARPTACCGLTLCEERCPNGSLVMGSGTEVRGAVPVDETLQSTLVSGLYLAGDVTGLPLIRNAINQGAHSMRAVHRELTARTSQEDVVEYDVIIVGAGPAGISAALEAKELGRTYLVLEQGSVAGSIQSFPRSKLVFDQPLDLPLVGKLWLEESTKEELLGRWLRIVRSEKLRVREQCRVTALNPVGGGFAVEAREGDGTLSTLTASKVLLAIGKRGAARRLPIDVPSDAESRVYYSLADARAFAGQRVVLVGLGDVAMEAAIALSRQPGTRVLVVHRGGDYGRGSARNIEALQQRVADGALEVRFDTNVASISYRSVELSTSRGQETVVCDGVFVLIGTIPPTTFLTRVGVLPHTAEKEKTI